MNLLAVFFCYYSYFNAIFLLWLYIFVMKVTFSWRIPFSDFLLIYHSTEVAEIITIKRPVTRTNWSYKLRFWTGDGNFMLEEMLFFYRKIFYTFILFLNKAKECSSALWFFFIFFRIFFLWFFFWIFCIFYFILIIFKNLLSELNHYHSIKEKNQFKFMLKKDWFSAIFKSILYLDP